MNSGGTSRFFGFYYCGPLRSSSSSGGSALDKFFQKKQLEGGLEGVAELIEVYSKERLIQYHTIDSPHWKILLFPLTNFSPILISISHLPTVCSKTLLFPSNLLILIIGRFLHWMIVIPILRIPNLANNTIGRYS